MPAVDVEALIEEDKKQELEYIAKPFRFGYEIDVDIDIKKDGLKKEFHNGDKLWLLKIYSFGAFSINLIYDNFKLGKGSKFYIYNEDRTMELDSFTPELCNNKDNVFATDLVQGNTIILEYYEPSSSDEGVIHINKVIHGYIDTFSDGYGTSANCNIDVMCPLENGWDNQKRAVCLIIMGGGMGSGCYINNTSEDFKPYILTANHLYFTGSFLVNDPSISIFRFKYFRSGCGAGTGMANYENIQELLYVRITILPILHCLN